MSRHPVRSTAVLGALVVGALLASCSFGSTGTATSTSASAASAATTTEAPASAPAVVTPASSACDLGQGATGSQPYREPVALSSEGGVLDVVLTIKQSTACLDTVGKPVSNFLTYSYRLVTGTSSDGQRSGDNLYPGPTLHVSPGETLIVKLDNELSGLTISDFIDPAWTPVGQPVALYPAMLTSAPYNNHTHGLHVSPSGNSDNVLLNIPPGESNTYTYLLPKNQPQGLYWYHSHRHQLTSPETYMGLTGMLAIGRVDGGIPIVTKNDVPIRQMNLQYNYVFDRAGGLAQLNNPSWQQFVSTLTPPLAGQLEDGSYEPKLTPTNFADSAIGTQFFTPWFTGPLGVTNQRGVFQYVPSNLLSFSSTDGTVSIPADPGVPDAQRDLQYTVNGQFEPQLATKPGQTEIWVLANSSDVAFLQVQLTETATGNHPKIPILAQDGNPSPKVHYPPTNQGTTLIIPPGNRFAIAVTMPKTGTLTLGMPTDLSIPAVSTDQQTTTKYPGIVYTNNGTANPPATLGEITVDPSLLSYWDGFFVFPTQTLLTAVPAADGGEGRTTPFVEGQPLDAYTSFVDLSQVKPAVKRTFVINGDFLNKNASQDDPKAFVYAVNNQAFDYTPLIQPRLNTVEEWKWINSNNDQHPMHVHINDFQVMERTNPGGDANYPKASGVQMWGQDIVTLPAPLGFPQEGTAKGYVPATTTIRTLFKDYIGTYVFHCHRLTHEDGGLMAIVNVIPEVSSYALALRGAGDTQVQVRDGVGDAVLATVTPFPGYRGDVTLDMSDVNGDQVLDLVVGAGKGSAPWVVAYSGAAAGGAPFSREIARFLAFDGSFRGGVSVAAADIDGNAMRDNIVVGSGPGMPSTITVFSSELPSSSGTAPAVFSSFAPYGPNTAGVVVATGLVDSMSGRQSIVAAPGPGGPATVKVFRYDLYSPITGASASPQPSMSGMDMSEPNAPMTVASFEAFDGNYTAGVSLTTGWLGGAQGGVQRIIVGQTTGAGEIHVFSSGSALTGEPTLYLDSPSSPMADVTFTQAAKFRPFTSGVSVATTSTTVGADLLVGATTPGGVTVKKYSFDRPSPKDDFWTPVRTGTVLQVSGRDVSLGGN